MMIVSRNIRDTIDVAGWAGLETAPFVVFPGR
jgi:hypothetical protein